MMGKNEIRVGQWTKQKALILSAVCLAGGIAGGWAIRGTHNAAAGPVDAVNVPATDNGANSATQAPNPARLKEMADAQAAALLAQLKSDPANPDLLTSLGNLYYDAQQYPDAVAYYGRALAVRPADPAARTDMGTAYWYMGNADSAIAEFNQVLTYAPSNANTLFNLGLVKWKANKDGAGAVAAWEKLLAANPNYEGKDKVEQMLAEVRGQTAVKPGTKAN